MTVKVVVEMDADIIDEILADPEKFMDEMRKLGVDIISVGPALEEQPKCQICGQPSFIETQEGIFCAMCYLPIQEKKQTSNNE